MIFKFISAVSAVALLFVIGFPESEAGPAYPGSTFNSWDTQPAPPQQQQPQRKNLPGQKKTFQGVVRQHIDDLDKQTQSDLKVLGYLENELNKIFSCYIKLSCPRMRSPKVVNDCDEIKDWPLYHQVMKMAGIRKYPYQSYGPSNNPRRILATTDLPELNQDEDTTTEDFINGLEKVIGDDDNETDEMTVMRYPQHNRQRLATRVRRGQKNQHHHHQHHLNGTPVTNDDAQ